MSEPITVYWRPGCGFCAGLLRGLERRGLAIERVNIWDDPEAAAFVRGVANGNETVPTVRVGPVALINPTAQDVLSTVAREAPHALPADHEPPSGSRLGRFLTRLLGG